MLMLITLASPGCATKKYVREQVSPVQQRADEANRKARELEGKEQKDVSRVEEREMTTENRANEAASAAQKADMKATQAGQTAQSASEQGQQNQTKITEVNRVVENLDNYKLASSQTVLFGFNKAQLTHDAEAQLDQLVQQANTTPHYVLEVEGFTDRTGAKEYNLGLSRRRADAVVRYLVDHQIPLRRIHMIGLGEGQPSTAEGMHMSRKEQRRVVVNLLAPATSAPSQ